MIRSRTTIAVLLLCLAAILNGCDDKKDGPKQILETVSVSEAVAMIQARLDADGFVLLDVRSASEYVAGHLVGAINHNLYGVGFDEWLAGLDKSDVYVVYCASGGRSRMAMEKMEDLDFIEVYSVSSGYSALKSAGAAVTEGN